MSIKDINVKTVNFIPSYACNLSCSYCYADKFEKDYPKHAAFQDFLKVYNHALEVGAQEFRIYGGEPTLWEFLDKSLNLLHASGIRTKLMTNGLQRTNVAPKRVSVSVHNISKGILKKLEDNLGWYKKEGCRIYLHLNISGSNYSKSLFDSFFMLAEKYADVIELGLILPFKLIQEEGDNFYEAVRRGVGLGKKISVPRPLPRCIFSHDQYSYLEKNISFPTTCTIWKKRITINPSGDLDKAFPCISVPVKIEKPLTVEEMRKKSEGIMDELQKIPPYERCQSCQWFGNECGAGCLVTHLGKYNEQKEVS